MRLRAEPPDLRGRRNFLKGLDEMEPGVLVLGEKPFFLSFQKTLEHKLGR